MPPPSEMIKPSLSLSNGLHAFSGFSFCLDRAFMALKPPTANGQIVDSLPPVMATSQSPRLIERKASPTAWVPAAQAVVTERLGPLAPFMMEICPALRLEMTMGIKNGVILRG